MPLQNRVTPEGAIVAIPERGGMMGNRGGCLHTPDRRLTGRRWVNRQWICCRLEFKHRHRRVMAPARYTELFFLDEATALAAGHRPCFECRWSDAKRFAQLWAVAHGSNGEPHLRASAADIDRELHQQRLDEGGTKRVHPMHLDELPLGAMVRAPFGPCLVLRSKLAVWTPGGYQPVSRPLDPHQVEVLTPPGIIAVMKLGYQPMLHGSAHELG